MKSHNSKNERLKHRYFRFLRGARRRSSATLDVVAKALDRFDNFNKYREFRLFRFEQAESFAGHLLEQPNLRTGEGLSLSTVYSTLRALKTFFQWLALQPGFRSRNLFSDAEYFTLSDKQMRIAKAQRIPRYPTPEQIVQTVKAMPTECEVQLRNRALLAFVFLTAARINAAASVQIGDIDLKQQCVTWDARHVRTKYSKTYITVFFPGIDSFILKVVVDWITWLRAEKGWCASDPLFPIALREINGQSPSRYLDRVSWKTTAPIRKIFREAFERVQLPYFNPHSFRHTVERLGEDMCRTDSERKAWSKNLGHEHVRTSLDAYAPMDKIRQLEIMRNMSTSTDEGSVDEATLKEVLRLLQQKASGRMSRDTPSSASTWE